MLVYPGGVSYPGYPCALAVFFLFFLNVTHVGTETNTGMTHASRVFGVGKPCIVCRNTLTP